MEPNLDRMNCNPYYQTNKIDDKNLTPTNDIQSISLEAIPNEIISHIFSFSENEWSNLTLVNKTWCALAKDQYKIKEFELVRKFMNALVEAIDLESYPSMHVNISKIFKEDNLKNIHLLKNFEFYMYELRGKIACILKDLNTEDLEKLEKLFVKSEPHFLKNLFEITKLQKKLDESQENQLGYDKILIELLQKQQELIGVKPNHTIKFSFLLPQSLILTSDGTIAYDNLIPHLLPDAVDKALAIANIYRGVRRDNGLDLIANHLKYINLQKAIEIISTMSDEEKIVTNLTVIAKELLVDVKPEDQKDRDICMIIRALAPISLNHAYTFTDDIFDQTLKNDMIRELNLEFKNNTFSHDVF